MKKHSYFIENFYNEFKLIYISSREINESFIILFIYSFINPLASSIIESL